MQLLYPQRRQRCKFRIDLRVIFFRRRFSNARWQRAEYVLGGTPPVRRAEQVERTRARQTSREVLPHRRRFPD